MSLLANGLNPDGMTWEDAADVVEVLVKTGRAVPGCQWIDKIVADTANDLHEGDF